MPIPEHVVICGGGVIGATIAYELAKRGVAATIIEADGVASGASGAAAGIVTPPLPWATDDPLYSLRRLGFDMHAELAQALPAEAGVDYGYETSPRVLLADSADEERDGRAVADRLAAAGVDGRWLDAAGVLAASGWIDRATRGGVVVDSPAQLDPYRYTLALVTAAERRGAVVRSGKVSGVVRDGDRVVGVRVGERVIEGDAVVIAMGPWSAEAAAWIGVPVPVEPLKGQIVRVRPSRPLRPFSFGHGGDYVVTKPDGLVFLGTTEEHAGFDREPTAAARDQIVAFARRFTSAFDDAELVAQTACLRPLSADGLPFIGAVPDFAGCYVATGHGRQGILMAPPTGRALVELMLDGASTCLDLVPFDPARVLRAS
ncbi:MAG: FAD-dependent oxidoreductase [Chloroflexi bacterium]|nr:FAD-dependent oxidoreductase [Chloroflexota bacterium]